MYEQRLHFDEIGPTVLKQSSGFSGASSTVKANAAGVGVGCDWLPRVSQWDNGAGFHFALGTGGIRWAQKDESRAPLRHRLGRQG